MERFMQWATENLQWNKPDLFGIYVITAALLFICLIGVLRKKAAFLVGFIARMTAGCACIVIVNEILNYYQMDMTVGLNALTLLTCSILGIPGVCLLYGLLFL